MIDGSWTMRAKTDNLFLALVTASSPREARKIARAVLKKKLAACVNIVPGIESHYWWEGKIERGAEVLLVIKTSRRHFGRVAATVRSVHSYSTPEIIALPVTAADARYARWWRVSLA